ncbi:MAG: type II toxin-antitoxin system PemK/MazF family toxin [Nocardioidaceae bacterium]
MSWPLARGQVVLANIPGPDEPKLYVVVSNNRRNQKLPQVLAARLTTTPKPPLPSVVPLEHPERFSGFVVCDDIVEIYQDEVIRLEGALGASTMSEVSHGLAAALDIPIRG